jgi:hypothetical protein
MIVTCTGLTEGDWFDSVDEHGRRVRIPSALSPLRFASVGQRLVVEFGDDGGIAAVALPGAELG